jgi:tRNA(adenine34) deaminase
MSEAIKLAKTAGDKGEVPVGAVIIDDNGDIIAMAHNLTETGCDPTAHAEILAIQMAAEKLNNSRLEACSLIVTLEPCAMCAAAISHARIKTLVYGAYDLKGGAVDNGVKFYNSPTCHHKPEVISGVMEKECGKLLKKFFNKLRVIVV